MKVGLVQDWLTEWGGAEKVLESICKCFNGPLYTIAYNPATFKYSYFDGVEIHPSFINKLPGGKTKYRRYLPLFPLAIESHDLSEFDLILSSSNAVAKGILKHSEQLHICYCHSPIRYAWDLQHQYLKEAKLNKGLKGFIAKAILHYIRMWDIVTVNRVDYFIANSKYIKNRIKKIYNRDSTVIYPPVDINLFSVTEKKENYYLAASRLVPYKKIDLIVKAFNKLKDKQLYVIGDGPEFKELAKLAGPNVKLLGYQPFSLLKEYIEKARGFVFAAKEDFGILPVEAMACGTPVIAYGKGGVTETVQNEVTGIFFEDQSEECLIQAIEKFETFKDFNINEIRKRSELFSRERFEREYKNFVIEKYNTFKNR